MDFRSGNGDETEISVADMGLFEAEASVRPAEAARSNDARSAKVDDSVAALGAEALAGALAAAASAGTDDSKTIHERRFAVVTDESRDALLTDFGKDTLDDRYLLPGRELSGPVRRASPSAYADDRGARPAALRLYLEAVVHAGDAGAVERRHRARPADLLLPQFGARQPRTASSTPGTRMSGSPRAAAASAPIGAMSAASASRSGSTARPAASSRSCA